MIGIYIGLSILAVELVLLAHQRTGFAGLGPRRWRTWLRLIRSAYTSRRHGG